MSNLAYSRVFKGKRATGVFTDDKGCVCVLYHSTIVAKFNPAMGEVMLADGGWHTVTTKARINQALQMWGSDMRLFQKDFNWYLSRMDSKYNHGEPFDYKASVWYPLRTTK